MNDDDDTTTKMKVSLRFEASHRMKIIEGTREQLQQKFRVVMWKTKTTTESVDIY
jgi:hypothetical protein